MSSICKSWSHFFSKNTCELDIVLTRTVNILTTNELVKLIMLRTTVPRVLNFLCKILSLLSWQCFEKKWALFMCSEIHVDHNRWEKTSLNKLDTDQNQIRILYWWHIKRHSFTRANNCEDLSLDLTSNLNLATSVLRTFSRGYYRCRECIPIPNGVWEETVLVNVSSSSSGPSCS